MALASRLLPLTLFVRLKNGPLVRAPFVANFEDKEGLLELLEDDKCSLNHLERLHLKSDSETWIWPCAQFAITKKMKHVLVWSKIPKCLQLEVPTIGPYTLFCSARHMRNMKVAPKAWSLPICQWWPFTAAIQPSWTWEARNSITSITSPFRYSSTTASPHRKGLIRGNWHFTNLTQAQLQIWCIRNILVSIKV